MPPWWCVSGLQTTLGGFFLQTVIHLRLLLSPVNGRERLRVHLKGISPSGPRAQLRSRLLSLSCLRIGVIAVQGRFQLRAQPVAVAVSLSWGHLLPDLLCPSHGGIGHFGPRSSERATVRQQLAALLSALSLNKALFLADLNMSGAWTGKVRYTVHVFFFFFTLNKME